MDGTMEEIMTCSTGLTIQEKEKKLSKFERYLTLWVFLCIVAGIVIGRIAPGFSETLGAIQIYNVSIPIAIALFFMMYPIMVKIDFAEVVKAGKTPKPVLLTLVVNWLIKPFTMFAIATFFLGYVFRELIPGTEILATTGETVDVYRSYISGAILLGIAPCTAMVLMWGYLAKGNSGHTLVMVAINSLLMLFFYAPLGGFLLRQNAMPIPWETIVLSVLIYVALPLAAGYYSRRWIIKNKGDKWFKEEFLKYLNPVAIGALLLTLILLFTFEGFRIIENPLVILYIAVPLFIQTL
jgi:arsenite transporter